MTDMEYSVDVGNKDAMASDIEELFKMAYDMPISFKSDELEIVLYSGCYNNGYDGFSDLASKLISVFEQKVVVYTDDYLFGGIEDGHAHDIKDSMDRAHFAKGDIHAGIAKSFERRGYVLAEFYLCGYSQGDRTYCLFGVDPGVMDEFQGVTEELEHVYCDEVYRYCITDDEGYPLTDDEGEEYSNFFIGYRGDVVDELVKEIISITFPAA